MADEYLAAAALPPLTIKIVLEQLCSGCARKLFMAILPDGGQVVCPSCGARHTCHTNLNEPLPLQDAAGIMGMTLPEELRSLSLGQVLALFENRINEDYRQIFQLFQVGGATIVRGVDEGKQS